MPGFNKIALESIVASLPDPFVIDIDRADDGFWRALITMKETGLKYDILTSRGDLKTWRNVADAIIYVQGICPECKDVNVKFEKWILVRNRHE